MIRLVRSDLGSFKTLEFHSGLNILLADKSEGATDRQSRNRAGKTSFVELVHFLFGADAGKESIFRSNALCNATFEVVFDMADETVSASRSGAKPSRIIVDNEGTSWPVSPEFDQNSGLFLLSKEDWKVDLGWAWFMLTKSSSNEPDERFQPSFRSLLSYFARRQLSGGFQQPMLHSSMQQLWDQQVSICYLLGLDWHIPSKLQELRNQEKLAQGLRKAAKEGDLGRFFGRSAELRTNLAVAEARARRLRYQLDQFQVVPEYKKLEREANDITRQIESLGAENVIDGQMLLELRASLNDEGDEGSGKILKVYEEAGLLLPGAVKRRFDEVERFHRAIIQNRRSHLTSEITSAEARIAERDLMKEKLDVRRQEIMGVLQSGGALEQYTALREELGRAQAEVSSLQQRLETAEKIESTKADLDIRRAQLVKAVRDDIHERRDIIRDTIVTFEELSASLYEQAGSLTVSDTANGPEFDVHIEGQRSKGITNMQMFCFDMMLAEISHKRGLGPGFLIHDSHLFDGVDERQVAKALQIGSERADAVGFQYIVTMNSDVLPKEGFKGKFDIQSKILKTKLTDATETGGLFGLRFN
jgi:uncharacterized protein YydD (DUF2326 family)